MQSEPKAHAKFSASGSERWLNCPGSIALSEKAPPQKESSYAKEGTDAHTCFEVIAKNPTKDVTKMLMRNFPNTMVRDALVSFNTMVKESDMQSSFDFLCETKVSLEFVEPDMFGTVDAAFVEHYGTLYVWDFKYGAGRVVEPDNNSQLIYYALGLAHKFNFDFEKVVIGVIQPRIIHKKGIARTWDISIPELRKWTDIFKEGVEAAKDPYADLKLGRWCFFCPAQSICPKALEKHYNEAQSEFDEIAE